MHLTTSVPSDSEGKAARGTIRISPGVLLQLIELTVLSVEGVGGLRSLRKHNRQHDIEEGSHSHDNGKIAVAVNGNQIDADVSIALEQGVNVAEATQEIRRRIGFAAGNMLGLTVRSANIFVDDIVSPAT